MFLPRFIAEFAQAFEDASDTKVIVEGGVEMSVARFPVLSSFNFASCGVFQFHAIKVQHELVGFDDSSETFRVSTDSDDLVMLQLLRLCVHPVLSYWKQPLDISMVCFQQLVVAFPL